MNLKIQNSKFKIQNSVIKISGSKSETNRLLLLQALFSEIELENASNSDDSEVMTTALANKDNAQHPTPNTQIIDIHHAGTAMRFLTAFFAMKVGSEIVLTGSSRMKERPIKILVDALKQLGADIEYVENYGFPPLSIWGKKLVNNKISLPANVSSQYISALLLIAPKLENGLELTLEGDITSVPYIKMTLALLNQIGVETSFLSNKIIVRPTPNNQHPTTITIESDWSSASYYYSIVALSAIGTEIILSSYKENSLQGDSVLSEIYKNFGVETVFNNNSIILKKLKNDQPSTINYQLNTCPDIAQTIAVTCFGLGISCHLSGLHTLKIKETDRLEALKIELSKLGAIVSITDDSLTLSPSVIAMSCEARSKTISITTYQDHRMAMAFAPLALITPIIIEEAEVVSKSYPAFWEDLKNIGFQISEI